MKLNISAEWLASFEEDEPAGFMTPRDREELNRRRAEAQSPVADRSKTSEAEGALVPNARRAEAVQAVRRGTR